MLHDVLSYWFIQEVWIDSSPCLVQLAASTSLCWRQSHERSADDSPGRAVPVHWSPDPAGRRRNASGSAERRVVSRAGYDSTPEEDPTRDGYTVVRDPRPTANVTIAGHSVMGVALKPYGLPGPQHGERGHRSRRLLLPGAASLVAALCLAAALAAFVVHPADAQSGDEASSPSHLTAVIADGEVILNWSSPAHDAASVTGYEILRRQRPKEGEIVRLILVADTGSTGHHLHGRHGKRAGDPLHLPCEGASRQRKERPVQRRPRRCGRGSRSDGTAADSRAEGRHWPTIGCPG